MKKSLRFTAAGLSICMMAAMLAGCSSSSSTDTTAAADASEAAADTQEAEAKTSDLSFAFCTNTLNNTFQSSIDAKLSELCKENGISYTCLDPDYDLNKQLSQLSDCANSGYDAVFVIPVDSAGITSGLAEIADAGIPIFNAYMAGQLVGEQMTKDYPDGAKIAVLDFPSNESCVDRVNGFLEGLGDQKDKFEIVAQQDGGAALDQSMGLAEDIITANPDLEAFFCINDPSALGAAAAIKAANKTGEIGVYSIDASPDGKQALLDGEFTAVACQVPLQIAEYAFDAAEKYVGGDTAIDEKKVYLDSHLVEKEEAEKTLNDWQ